MRSFACLVLLAGTASAAPTCIPVRSIVATDTPDDRTIVFHMQDRSVLRNELPAPCPGLRQNIDGFTYTATPGTDEVCETETAIRLNWNGTVCQLGPFRPVHAAVAR